MVRIWPQHIGPDAHPEGHCSFSRDEDKGLLSVLSKNEVALAKRASSHHLNRIRTASIIFHDGHELLIGCPPNSQPFHENPGSPKTEGQPRADMPMKCDASIEFFGIRRWALHL